jgi:hypothetical protein
MADDSGGETGAEAATRTFVTTMIGAVLFCAAMTFLIL